MNINKNIAILLVTRFEVFLFYGFIKWCLPITIVRKAGLITFGLYQSISMIPNIFMFISGFISDIIGNKKMLLLIPSITLLLFIPLLFEESELVLMLALLSINFLNFESPAAIALLVKSTSKEFLGRMISMPTYDYFIFFIYFFDSIFISTENIRV